jgi:hypothetical protein
LAAEARREQWATLFGRRGTEGTEGYSSWPQRHGGNRGLLFLAAEARREQWATLFGRRGTEGTEGVSWPQRHRGHGGLLSQSGRTEQTARHSRRISSDWERATRCGGISSDCSWLLTARAVVGVQASHTKDRAPASRETAGVTGALALALGVHGVRTWVRRQVPASATSHRARMVRSRGRGIVQSHVRGPIQFRTLTISTMSHRRRGLASAARPAILCCLCASVARPKSSGVSASPRQDLRSFVASAPLRRDRKALVSLRLCGET